MRRKDQKPEEEAGMMSFARRTNLVGARQPALDRWIAGSLRNSTTILSTHGIFLDCELPESSRPRSIYLVWRGPTAGDAIAEQVRPRRPGLSAVNDEYTVTTKVP